MKIAWNVLRHARKSREAKRNNSSLPRPFKLSCFEGSMLKETANSSCRCVGKMNFPEFSRIQILLAAHPEKLFRENHSWVEVR